MNIGPEQSSSNSEPLSEAMLLRAVSNLRRGPIFSPCKRGEHLVSPAGYELLRFGGQARCVSCLGVVGPFPVEGAGASHTARAPQTPGGTPRRLGEAACSPPAPSTAHADD